jgi:hypothetical protein
MIREATMRIRETTTTDARNCRPPNSARQA